MGEQMELGMLIACGIISSLALLLSCTAIILIMAKEKSTHTIQMVPVDEEIERANEEFLQKWATSEDAVNKQNKMFQEDLKDKMPEFSLDEEDKEIFSI